MITEREHWRIVWAALTEAVRVGDADGRTLAEAAAKMIETRAGATAYEVARAYARGMTKRVRARTRPPSSK